MTPEDLWRQKSNKELKAAARQLEDYPENIQQVIHTEISRRISLEYADFCSRFIAHSIDGIILSIVDTLFFKTILSLSKSASLNLNIDAIWITIILINWLYYALLESSSEQATLGKQALGIFVTDLDGNRISFGKATGRFFCKLLSFITTSFVGCIMAAFTKKHQALHDLLAGTLVMTKN